MRVLVIGGTGLISTAITSDLVGRGDDVTVYNRGRREAAARMVSPRFVDHDGPDPEHGYEALLRAVPGLLRALPDARFTVEQLVGEGDTVAVRVRGEATHSGALPGKPPTGKRVTWTENEFFRLEDGKLAESWGEGGLDEALASVGLGFRAAPR